ncbi:helix-turn-helix transcriptional regulator [Pseudomonas congelans]|uniref:helix-turn-helix transcriptional regulator n=1 Tax=Pseudomonas TaxID=286 RepID=UPI000BB5CA6D|nr:MULTISPECIES: helix-turn-helix transcriptional regulator [Pseudomonas]MBC8801302.1 helix-turn-helix transcriptional regulator [Pseudomonas congelans]MBP1143341.1 DNA-binding CsgD family transcriptional regulator [Pseudomonas sp. PvP027]MCF5166665.1 helix-turn-helix transcriptional regulator [Pseudomonas congelans]PBP87619.1 helix-turn-helix transcriptional regulator [Pseudomonas congelans]PBQ18381.1 helix-turn-helix transcriptional regulator [Pseudomonas congelans]
MNTAQHFEYNDDPRFYLQLAKLVSSTGDDTFAGHMLQLVDSLVPIHGLGLSEWTLDLRESSISRINLLGGAGLQHDPPGSETTDHPLLSSILNMQDPLLIQLKTPLSAQHPQQNTHQCNLVSSHGERRLIICFYRLTALRAFSLTELSLLKSLSDTLLPLVEHHAQSLAQSSSNATRLELEPGSLDQAFSGRLAQDSVTLSAREQEVCLGLLTGGTVAEMAQRLKVKNSSVETYLKRATAKLGVSGRHGLARWMAGD